MQLEFTGETALWAASWLCVAAALLSWRRVWSRRGRPLGGLDALAAAVGLVALARLPFEALPAVAAFPNYFDTIDVWLLARAVREGASGTAFVTHPAGLVPGLLLPGCGLSAERWVLALWALHLVNVGLLWWLARALGLQRLWAFVAAALFAGIPSVGPVLKLAYIVEIVSVMGFLGVALGYLVRSRASGAGIWAAGLLLELLSVFLGASSRSAFIVYPGVLVAVDLLWLPARRSGTLRPWLRGLARRMAPHAILFPFALLWLVPSLAFRLGRAQYASSFSPLSLVVTAAERFAEFLFPVVGSEFGIALGGTAVALLLLGILRPGRRPALRCACLLTLVLVLPVAAVTQRFFIGYAYASMAGVVLAAVAVWASPGSRVVRGVVVAWALAVALSTPLAGKELPPSVSRELVHAAAEAGQTICAEQPPTWRVPRSVAGATQANLRALLAAGRPEALPFEPCARQDDLSAAWRCLARGEQEDGESLSPLQQARVLAIIVCRDPDARAELAEQ